MHKLLKILIYVLLYVLDCFDKSKYNLDSTGKIVNSFALKNVKTPNFISYSMLLEDGVVTYLF